MRGLGGDTASLDGGHRMVFGLDFRPALGWAATVLGLSLFGSGIGAAMAMALLAIRG